MREMSTNRNSKRYFRTGAAGLLAGCLMFSYMPGGLAQDNSSTQPAAATPAPRTDADIQSDIGYALTHDATLKGQQITSTTSQGTVILSGTVKTNAQRQQAETIAAGVQGVIGIANNLNVTNPEIQTPVAATPAAPDPGLAIENAQSPVPPPPPDEGGVSPSTQAQGNNAPTGSYGQPANNGARAPYQPPQGGYAPQQQQAYNPPPPPPSGPVTIPAGTLVRIRLSEPLDPARVQSGAVFQATAAADIYQGGVLAIPRGAVLQGSVVKAKKAGELGGSALLELQLTNVNLQGQVFPLTTDVWSSKGPNKAGYTAGNTIGGAAVGALIGGIIGRGAGAAIGAGVGGAAGLATSSATNGPRLILPVESQVDFHLANAVTVQPVSWQEAQRLASSSSQQQPQLVRRPRPYPYPYGYPYPY
jgi:BON domain